MMIRISQYYIRTLRPVLLGWMTKILFGSKRVRIGKNFRTDGIPRILVDKSCKIIIGDNVEFRRNVEIRSHGNSTVKIGSNVRVDRGVRLLAANNAVVSLNDEVRVGLYSVFNGGDSIFVGKKSLISGFVYLQTSMHGFSQKTTPIQDQSYEHAPVKLEDDTWLGTHVVVLPGVTIHQGGVVGSNAVVNKDVSAYQVVAGIPAKPIKERE
mgnify:CR=1 FL=1|jgi:acetyltransferase-like isoleucine patch superfamily enzyme